MPRSAADPRLVMEKVRLIFFIARHALGIVIFLGLTVACFRLNSAPLGYLFLVLTPVYAGFAFVTGRSLLRRARLMEQRRAMAAAASSGGN